MKTWPSLIIPMLLMLFSPFVMSANSQTCSKIAQVAGREKVRILGYTSGRKVIGKGCLYFYFAPDMGCKMKRTFVVPNDHVEAYSDYKGFAEVVYWDAKGNNVGGWVVSNRLAETGTGIGNKEEEEGRK